MRLIRMVSHAYADESNVNAQNLAVREIARRLDPDQFEMTLFFRESPDRRLTTRPNVRLRRLHAHGKAATFLGSTLLGGFDVNFYVRNDWVAAACLRARPFVAVRQRAIYHVLTALDTIDDERILATFTRAIQGSQLVVSNSAYVARSVESTIGVSTDVIRDMVDLDRFRPREPRSRPGPVRFLYAGSLQERKRPWLVLAAAEAIPEAEFHIVGSGPLQVELERRASALANVQMSRAMPQQALADLMRASDVFLFPSTRMEGAPQVLTQAAASALPVVAFDEYETEAVEDGVSGYLVTSERALVEATKALARNPNLRSSMGTSGRDLALRRFAPDVIMPQWERAILQVVREPGASPSSAASS